MAISAGHAKGDHAGMAITTNATAPTRGALRRLTLVGATTTSSRPLDRDEALRRVRDAKRHVEARSERFAYLKRVYD
jgi:hypothetical protein